AATTPRPATTVHPSDPTDNPPQQHSYTPQRAIRTTGTGDLKRGLRFAGRRRCPADPQLIPFGETVMAAASTVIIDR
ncbi:hypothetical protein, partial [Streptomyces sp. NPDC059994]|uniref:hypothetical protein n=1 Tax=Streptomyces sp. NPDC059994 TaxID=3347029 RepID=UPI003698D0C8